MFILEAIPEEWEGSRGVKKNRNPPNQSSQKLATGDFLQNSSSREVTSTEWVTIFILFFVNLINYMDRYTLAGILDDVQEQFNITKGQQGLIQTVFVISYMIFAPIFGYLGDRYSRKALMSFGVLLWSLTTLVGSFMTDYIWFITFRALVGIGEASYSTIAPTIISDLFLDDVRSKMLALFYFAIPVGGGLGYIVGGQAAKIGEAWYWALRVTPGLGVIAVVLMLFFMIDPPRGEREGSSALKTTSWGEDMKYLCTNKSFMLSTLGFTCVAFVTGALAWWGPSYIHYGLRLQEDAKLTKQSDVSFYFGVITAVSGIIGVPLGVFAATKLRVASLRADPLICAFGLLISTPLIFGGAYLARHHEILCFVLIFFGQVFLNLNWAIVADILLYVVIPTRRSTAEAFQILLSHALGDAGSPYLVGVFADWIKGQLKEDGGTDYQKEFVSFQYSLYTTVVIQVLGGVLFLVTALYIINDKKACDGIIAQSSGISENMGGDKDMEMKSSESASQRSKGGDDDDDDEAKSAAASRKHQPLTRWPVNT